MRLIRKDILLKIKHKNKGNIRLSKAIDELISEFENSHWRTKEEIITGRPDADQVNN